METDKLQNIHVMLKCSDVFHPTVKQTNKNMPINLFLTLAEHILRSVPHLFFFHY